jgi:DNA polymerase IV (DinB-like DNA polymerase)
MLLLQARIIMLVDLDYFYAQSEEKRNPSLKDKPVVICVYSGRTEESGAVSTANYIARKYGVRSGIPISLAKKKLKDTGAVFIPVDHAFYREISEKIMDILRSQADQFEQVGVDEAYLDVTQRIEGNYEEAKKLATKIKVDIWNKQQLTCSIGVGPNKLVAKIAADIRKPDGLTVIEPGGIGHILYPLPVSRLIGVGKKTVKKMASLGIRTIGDLSRFDVQGLMDVFGKNLGTYFHNASMGIDDEPVQEREAESLSRISTLKENTRELEVILEEADKLSDQVHTKLTHQELEFRSVSILVVATDLSIHSRSKTFENPTKDLQTLKKIVKELFTKFLSESDIEARRIGIKVANLTKEEENQKQLTSFFEPSNN